MQTIANSELVRIFMQRKLQNYQKKKMEKKNEQMAKPCCSMREFLGQAWNDGPHA